jgi:hypothetical protein
VKKEKKIDTIRFSSEFKNNVLTSILKYYKDFADRPKYLLVSALFSILYLSCCLQEKEFVLFL